MNSVLVLMAIFLIGIVNPHLVNNGDALREMEENSAHTRVKRGTEPKSSFYIYEKIEIVKKHNLKRRIPGASNMEIMYWDSKLEAVAQKWAENCAFAHNQNRKEGTGYSSVGENIYFTTGGIEGETDKFINAWYNEIDDYTYDTNSCAENEICGHYTQMEWYNSRAVGCGVKFCETMSYYGKTKNNANFVVCDYGPGGNFVNVKPYTTGTKCADCPTDKNHCDDGLCSVENCGGRTCENGGKLVAEICFCDCRNTTDFEGDTCEIAKSGSGRGLENTYPLMISALFLLISRHF